jgi:anti-sigma factor RsiW
VTFLSPEARARRYLLGQASDEESFALEGESFADERALDRIAAVEDLLIEDYLAGALSADDRERFERHYLASPEHRARVEIVRRLSSATSSPWYGSITYLATAAALLLAVGSAVWMAIPERKTMPEPVPPAVAEAREQATPAPPRVFAVSLPAITVRGASESTPVVVPDEFDVLGLELQAAANLAANAAARAVIETVAGDEVWQGPLSASTDPNGAAIGHVEVPVASLRPDDYIVVWLETDAAGATHERGRYVLRLRT